ncbi:hypothetical protein M9Y10_030747 [Tritrichomonas musculus]|uniref:Phosphoprotein phosphatase n=1 Tax=Tritrichomonas musculus TaxID=1915356 RepID=A0ABR2H2T7_9EUKA
MYPRPAKTRKSIEPANGKKTAKKKQGSAQENPRTLANQILKNRKTLSVPISDMPQGIGLQRAVSSTYSVTEYQPIAELPELSSVSEENFNDLLRQKLEQCCHVCNFADPGSGLKDKDLKSNYLQEIYDYLCKPNFFTLIEPQTLDYFLRMIKHNVIRSMPPLAELSKVPIFGDDINDKFSELSWPHLRIVYEIFLKLLDSKPISPQIFLRCFTAKFIHRILALFNSADQRERNYLKMVLFKIYLKFATVRLTIRQAIQHLFHTYTYEIHYFSGITELLEIMYSIINGFNVPLKEEHKNFLITTLLPLYTSNFLHLFHESLFHCVSQYVNKENTLITHVIKFLMHIWPATYSFKEAFFVRHLMKYIEMINEDQFVELMIPLFHRIGSCILSTSYQVSELAILLWKNDKFILMTVAHSEVLFPVICPYLYKAGTSHWNTTIRNESVSVIRIFMVMSNDVFTAYSKSLKNHELQELKKLDAKKSFWTFLIDNGDIDADDANEKKKSLDRTFPELKNFKKTG